MMRAPIRLSPNPVCAISRVVIFPVPKIIALGAVATGNINAQLALSAAGSINVSGSICALMAAAAKMGISSVVVAVLLVISVRKVTLRQMRPIETTSGQVLSPVNV